MATVEQNFRVKNGLRVDNSQKENIFEVNNTVIESQRTIEANSASASDIPLIINSKSLQSADLQQWRDETDAVLASMDKDGKLFVQDFETQNHVVIGGNLTVNGTTTTINSIVSTVDDPVIMLGGDTAPTEFDGKWRGVEFRWHDGTAAKTGFFGFESTNNTFTFIPDATNEGEIFTGDLGDFSFRNGFFDGNVTIYGHDIVSDSTYFNLLAGVVQTIYFGNDATYIKIGADTGTTEVANNLDVKGVLTTDGNSFDSTDPTFDLLATPTTVNFGASATDVQIGAATGTTNVNNDLDVDGNVSVDGNTLSTTSTTFNLLDTTATTVNFAGTATDLQLGADTGVTNINNNVNIDGGELSSTSATFDILDTPTTINLGASATDIQIGSSTGTTNVNNNLDVDGDINVDGGDITASNTTFNLLNTTVQTINFGGTATDIQIGSATGTTNVNNNLDVDGDVNVDGGDLTVSSATFNLVNDTATTVNFAGAATNIQIGSTTGTTNINNNLDVDGDINVDGGDLTVSSSVFNLANDTATTVNFAGAATDVQIGSANGTTNINNNLDVDGDVSIDGGDLDATTTSFNLLASPTTLDIGASATDIQVGADTGTTTIRNNLTVEDVLTISGATTNFNPPVAGTAPFTVGANAFDVLVAGLNADKLDGQTGTWYQDRVNHTGLQPSTTISDWSEAVQDVVGPMFVHSQQTGVAAQYNDETGRILLTVTAAGGGGGADFSLSYWMGV